MLWGVKAAHIHKMMIDAPSYINDEEEEPSKEVKKNKLDNFLANL